MTPGESEVTSTYIISPPNTNMHGTAFGGQIMSWMDEVAAIVALRYCKMPCVTVAVDNVQFTKPIAMGHIVIIKARVNFVGRSSMEIGVRVRSEDPMTGIKQHALTGYMTFVAVDADNKPCEIPSLSLRTDTDERRYVEAHARWLTRKGL